MFLLLLTLLTFFQGIIFFKINEWRYIYIYIWIYNGDIYMKYLLMLLFNS